MIRVGFDGRALGSPAGGVRRYVRELFGALAARGDVDVTAVGAHADAILPPGVRRGPSARSLPTNAGWILTGLPRAARQARVDLLHAPAYTAPLAGPHPLVVTIHDVSYERRPRWYPYRRDPLRRAFYRASARAADRVITDSAFSRNEIAAGYGIDPASIAVVPLAPAACFTPGDAGPPEGIATPFVLHVGDVHPRRNIPTLVRAARRAGVAVVLAGADPDSARALAAESDVRIHAIPVADDARLVALYRGASALVYPSRYEGFGLPLVEAMACGTPVIAARAGSIPEVVGDAAPLLDPDDDEGFAKEILRLIRDPAVAAAARAASLARAAAFSWPRTAALTLDVYRAALEQHIKRSGVL